MANLTQDDVADFVQNAPPGMSSQAVIRGLIAQGHTLDGYTPHNALQQPQRQEIGSIPVYDTGLPVIGKIADWTVPVANWIKQNATQPLENFAEGTRKAYPGRVGNTLGDVVDFGKAMIPDTPGQIKLQLGLPLASKAIGMAGRAALAVPGVSEAVSGTTQALSRLSAPLVEKVLATPEILSRYLPVDEAGEVMSKFFGQLGLKSGSEALASEAENLGKAAPKLGDFAPIANQTVTAIKNEPQTMQAMQQLEQEANQLGSQLNQSKDPQMIEAAHQRINDLMGEYKDLQKQLPNAQDAITARQYLSKVTSKMANQAAEEQVVQPIAQGNKQLVTNWLDNKIDDLTTQAFKEGKEIAPIDVPGYGKVTTPAQVRQIYHEAKIGEAFSSFFPQNRNGQVDSLRTFLGIASGNPKALLESPQVWKRAIQLGSAVGNPSNAAGLAEAGTTTSNLLTPKENQ